MRERQLKIVEHFFRDWKLLVILEFTQNILCQNKFVYGLQAHNIQSRLLEQRQVLIEKDVEIPVRMETSDAAQLDGSSTAGKHNFISIIKIQNFFSKISVKL